MVVALALSIAMTGSGTLGPVVPGWSITEQCTPVALGDASGSVGSVNGLTTKVKSDSRYVQDNPVALTHDTAGVFRGSVQSVAVDALSAAAEISGGLSFLVADRTMPPVWLDNTADRSFLSYGAGTGQVATAYGIATDPFDDSIFITSYGIINVNLLSIDRYKVIKFSSTGVFISEFGANGTGNGQFTGPMSVAVSPVDGSVFVSDGSQTRITKFTTSDRINYTYSTKWGSLGSGNSQFGSASLAINIDTDSAGNVFAADRGNARIQKFTSAGAYSAQIATTGPATFNPYDINVDSGGNVYVSIVTQGLGTAVVPGIIAKYNNALTTLLSTVTIPGPANTQVGILTFAIDGSGNFWADWGNATYLVKYDSSGNELFRWQSTYPVPVDLNTNYNLAVNSAGAVTVVYRSASFQPQFSGNYVTEFNYIPVTLSTTLQRYMASCDPSLNGFTFSYLASSNPNVVVPGWTGDVWTKIKEACCVFAIEIALVGTVITVRDAGSLSLNIINAGPKTTTPNNTFGGQEVDLTYQSPVAGGGVMYSAAAVAVIWSVDVGQRNVVTVTGTTYPTALGQPIPTDVLPIQPGQYFVVDTNGLAVPAATWLAAGGQILAAPGTAPGTITITFIGPGATIPGFVAPFYFATDRTPAAVGALSIAGPGVICTPGTIQLLTGADPARTTQQVAFSSASPFIDTIARAYDRGSASSDAVASPSVDVEFDMPTAKTNGFGRTAGATFALEGSIYRVTEARFGNVTTHIKATRFTKLAGIDTAWSGQTFGTYDTFWSGYSAGDQQIQPLLTQR
jgi:hypothetical protein